MELMEVLKGTKFRLNNADETQIPPDATWPDAHEVYTAGRLDGVYCSALDSAGTMVYFAAWTDVTLI